MNKQNLNKLVNQWQVSMKFGTREEWENRPEKLIWKNNCPFCEHENLKDFILWTWKYWYVIENKYPYTGDNRHLLLIPKNHCETSTEIPAQVWSELQEAHTFIKNFYWSSEYFSFKRETFWERSIKHYHMHFLPWVITVQPIIQQLKNQWII